MENIKILIVEDEAVIAMSMQEKLNNIGYSNIDSAFTEKEANGLLNNNNYDLVLMDVKLGGNIDGIDIVNAVKEKIDLPVIYVTGNSDSKTVQKAKLSTPYGFLKKPVHEADLKIQMEIALHKEKVKKLSIEDDKKMQVVDVHWKRRRSNFIIDTFHEMAENNAPVFDYLSKMFIPGVTFEFGL